MTYAADYRVTSRNEILVSFNLKEYFAVPLTDLTYEDENFLELLYYGTKYGANFITDDKIPKKNYRDKTFLKPDLMEREYLRHQQELGFT